MKRILILLIAVLLVSCSSSQEASNHEGLKELKFKTEENDSSEKIVGSILEFDHFDFQVINVYSTHEKIEKKKANVYIAEVLYLNKSDDYILISPFDLKVKNSQLRSIDFIRSSLVPNNKDESVYMPPSALVKRFYSFAVEDDLEPIITIQDEFQELDVNFNKKIKAFDELTALPTQSLNAFEANTQALGGELEVIVKHVENIRIPDRFDESLEKTFTVLDVEFKNKGYTNGLNVDFYLRDEEGALHTVSSYPSEGNIMNSGRTLPGGVCRTKLYFENYEDYQNMSLAAFTKAIVPEIESYCLDVNLNGPFNSNALVSDFNTDQFKVHQLNETATYGDYEITMTNIYDKEEAGSVKPKENNVFRFGKFKVTNTAGESAGLSPSVFKIVNNDGFAHEFLYTTGLKEKIFTIDDILEDVGSEIERYAFAEVIKGNNYLLVFDYANDEHEMIIFDYNMSNQ